MKKKSNKIYSVCLLFSNRQQENLNSLPIWVWENNYLIKASSLDVVNKRSIQLGKEIESHSYEMGLTFNGQKGCQIFEGIVNVSALNVYNIGTKLVINEKFYLIDKETEFIKFNDFYEDSEITANFSLEEIIWNLQKFSKTIKNKLLNTTKLVNLQRIFILSLLFEIKPISLSRNCRNHIIVESDVIIQGKYKNRYNEELNKFLKILKKNENSIINKNLYEFKYLGVRIVISNCFYKHNKEMFEFVDEYGYKEFVFKNELDLKSYLNGDEVKFLYLGNKLDFPPFVGQIEKIIKDNISKKSLIYDLIISFKLNYNGLISGAINVLNKQVVNEDIKQLLALFYEIDWPKWKPESQEYENQEYEINIGACK